MGWGLQEFVIGSLKGTIKLLGGFKIQITIQKQSIRVTLACGKVSTLKTG